VRYPRDGPLPPRVAVLQCMHARRTRCATVPPTTLPPVPPDLAGHWTLAMTGTSGDCPEGVNTYLGSSVESRPNVGALQTGADLNTCAAGAISAGIDPLSATVSEAGFVSTRHTATVGPPFPANGFYDVSRQLRGQFRDDHVDVVYEWDLSPTGEPSGRTPCIATFQGVWTP